MLAIYGRRKDSNSYRGFNVTKKKFANHEYDVYPTSFSDEIYDELQEEVDYMNEHNKNYVFEIWKI